MYTGCFCPPGTVEKGNTCVAPEDCDSVSVAIGSLACSLPPVTGPCKALFFRYYYDSTTHQCQQFIYGGCQGNSNNFKTIEECEAACMSPNTYRSA